MFRKEIIRGCEGREDADRVYLTRYIIFQSERISIFLHKFSESDYDDMHDHPWDFYSFILWGGYNEQTPLKNRDGSESRYRNNEFIKPGRLIFRKAEHIHRVVLREGNKKAWSLVVTLKKRKKWGFFTKLGFLSSREYFEKLKC